MATLKQKRLASILSENIRCNGNKTMGQMMREAGYSITTSKKPKLATKGKGFQKRIAGTKMSEIVGKEANITNEDYLSNNPYITEILP